MGRRFSYRLDSGPWVHPLGSRLLEGPQSFAVGNISEGFHKIDVRAVDVTGAEDKSPARYQWQVRTSPPKCSWIAAPPPVDAASHATFQLDCIGEYALKYSVDYGRLVPLQSEQDSDSVSDSDSDLTPGGRIMRMREGVATIRVEGLGDGAHLMQPWVTDALGNAGPGPSHAWIVDTGPPTAFIEASPRKQSHDRDARFAVACSERNCTYRARLDHSPSWVELRGGAPGSLDSARAAKGKRGFKVADVAGGEASSAKEVLVHVTSGFHTLEIRAVDAAGNAPKGGPSYEWVVF